MAFEFFLKLAKFLLGLMVGIGIALFLNGVLPWILLAAIALWLGVDLVAWVYLRHSDRITPTAPIYGLAIGMLAGILKKLLF
jgi:hypothetical protein